MNAIMQETDRRAIIIEDVGKALPGFRAELVQEAQSRALRHYDRGFPLGSAIDKAIRWARESAA